MYRFAAFYDLYCVFLFAVGRGGHIVEALNEVAQPAWHGTDERDGVVDSGAGAKGCAAAAAKRPGRGDWCSEKSMCLG